MILPLLTLLTTAIAAGVGVHTTLVSRVHQFLPQELQTDELLPFVIAGAFFPDAFYTCGAPATSEAAHWPPFIAAAVDHYRRSTHKSPQLKAFIYGVFTHQIADSSWHSIRLHEGLLKMLAHMEFGGDTERAHQFLDTAGDFFLLNKIGTMDYFLTQWQLPELSDLRQIFTRLNIETREFELKYCTLRGESALRAETTFAKTAAPMNAQISPLLEDTLDDYYLGGLREIEQSVIRCMPHLTDWFDKGAPSDPWSLCGAIIAGEDNEERYDELVEEEVEITREGTVISPYTPLSNFGHALTTGNFLQEPSLAISSQYEEGQGSVYILPLSEFTHTSISSFPIRPQNQTNPFHTPAKFGTAMMTYTLFHESFLFITEPGTSSIYVYSGNRRLVTIKDHNSTSLYGGYGRKQQGVNMMARDVDKDGFQEVFISAPFSDIDDRTQSGEVIVLSGEKLGVLLFLGHEVVVDIDELVEHRIRVPEEYRLKDGYEQFGSVVSVDQGMIYVTCPGLGVVFCFDYEYDLKQVIMKEQTDRVILMRRKSSETGMFAQRWMITGHYNSQKYLIAGAHMENQGSVVAGGAVYVYTVEEFGVMFLAKLVLPPGGMGNVMAKFGTSGVVYDDVLYISAPGYFGSGAVFNIQLSNVFNGMVQAGDPIIVNKVFMEGSGPGYTGFGESLEAYNRYLLIGEPNFGYGEMFDDNRKMMGRVGIYKV